MKKANAFVIFIGVSKTYHFVPPPAISAEVPSYLRERTAKTSRGCLKPQTVPNPTYATFLPIPTYYDKV